MGDCPLHALTRISRERKRPNGVVQVNGLSLNDLPNGGAWARPQHLVPHGRMMGRYGDPPALVGAHGRAPLQLLYLAFSLSKNLRRFRLSTV